MSEIIRVLESKNFKSADKKQVEQLAVYYRLVTDCMTCLYEHDREDIAKSLLENWRNPIADKHGDTDVSKGSVNPSDYIPESQLKTVHAQSSMVTVPDINMGNSSKEEIEEALEERLSENLPIYEDIDGENDTQSDNTESTTAESVNGDSYVMDNEELNDIGYLGEKAIENLRDFGKDKDVDTLEIPLSELVEDIGEIYDTLKELRDSEEHDVTQVEVDTLEELKREILNRHEDMDELRNSEEYDVTDYSEGALELLEEQSKEDSKVDPYEEWDSIRAMKMNGKEESDFPDTDFSDMPVF